MSRRITATNTLLSFAACSGESGSATVRTRVASRMAKTIPALRLFLEIVLILPVTVPDTNLFSDVMQIPPVVFPVFRSLLPSHHIILKAGGTSGQGNWDQYLDPYGALAWKKGLQLFLLYAPEKVS